MIDRKRDAQLRDCHAVTPQDILDEIARRKIGPQHLNKVRAMPHRLPQWTPENVNRLQAPWEGFGLPLG